MAKVITTFSAPDTEHAINITFNFDDNDITYDVCFSDSLKSLTDENDNDAKRICILAEMFLSAINGNENTNNDNVIVS